MKNQKNSSTQSDLPTEVSQSDVVLEQVASALSHDIRTPLRHTQHFLDFFESSLEQPISQEAEENMALVRSGLQTASQMVETLIAFARLDQNVDRQTLLRIPDLVVEAMYRTRIGLDVPDASLSVTGQAHVAGNEMLLLSLFAHLFDNCVMFMPEGQPAKISVSMEETSEDNVLVTIDDNGEGVRGTSEAAFRLFQSGLKNRKGQGLGVGLSFARRIAEIHGGELTIAEQASPLGGARLCLVLPKPPAV